MDWSREVRVGKTKMTLKEIYFSIPIRYEYRETLVHQIERGCYVFNFTTQSISYITNNQMRVTGDVNGKVFSIVHSKRMGFLFKKGFTITLRGIVTNNSCFFPDSYDTRIGIVPIYYNTSHLIGKVMNENPVSDFTLNTLFRKIHLPSTINDVLQGFDGLFAIELASIFYTLQQQRYERSPIVIGEVDCGLTPMPSQSKVLENIYALLRKSHTMNCMLYGDVGSGKTLIGYIVAMQFINSGKAVAYLVPTTVLASQVYDVFSKWTDKIVLVTSKTRQVEQKAAVYIGTHALLHRELPNLGLLIIDEQHKFGVEQRNFLFHKHKCDVLMMTATPIPRTFQVITSGLMSFETLETPSIQNILTVRQDRETVLQEALEQAKSGIVFWVLNDIQLVEQMVAKLNSPMVYMIHSEVKNKVEILKSVKSGLVVSTTVVEVGVDLDVKMLIVENASNFGVSQLHQLWGRVGRRGIPGQMILISEMTPKILGFSQTTTGWERSKIDYEKRGPGTLHNVLQAGKKGFLFGYTLNEKKDVIDRKIDNEILMKAQCTLVRKEYVDLFAIANSL